MYNLKCLSLALLSYHDVHGMFPPAYIADEGKAAALWIPPGLESDDSEIGEILSANVPAEIRENAMAMFGEMDAYHPHDAPCWFLPMIAADPAWLDCGSEGYLGDKTNIGFNAKFNKKRTNVQGSLLMIRHTVDEDCLNAGNYRVKSNAIDGLAIGNGTDDGTGIAYDWAAFSGKSTYREPGLDNEGNHHFLVYVEDRDEEGCNQDPADEFWIEVKDGSTGDVVFEVNGPLSDPAGSDGFDGDDEPIECGNIYVPHQGKGGGGGGGKPDK